MHNKWNSANVDQVLLRKGEEHLLYRGPEGSVVRNDHLVMSDIADGPALGAVLRSLWLVEGGRFFFSPCGKRWAFLRPPWGQ